MSAVRGLSRATSARLLAGLMLLAVTAASAHGQQTGSVLGKVRTADGVVANARAVLDSVRETRSDSTGRFYFRDVTAGSNGAFSASAGYDMVTGIGVPNVKQLISALP